MREMKDSGIPWMGDIPVDWKVERVKHGFVRKKEEAHQKNPIVLSLARTGVKERDISNNEGQIAESYYNYNPVDVDDLLINPMDLYSGANCSISKIKGVISSAYVNLRYRGGYNPNYYDYYFKVQYWMMAFFAHGKGVSYENRWTLNAETLMNYPIIVPSYNEQSRIVDYLNSKCSKIDSIIEKQQEIIEKLLLKSGDFLLTRSNTRDLVGQVCIVDDVDEQTIFSDLIYRITFNTKYLLPDYALFVLQTSKLRQQISRDAHGSSSTMVKITHKDIVNWEVTIPSLEEQQQTVKCLRILDEYISTNIEKREKLIDKLQEYKKSLIYEVVKGKKEV